MARLSAYSRGSSSGTLFVNLMLFWLAAPAIIGVQSSTTSLKFKSSFARVCLPASTVARSRISLINASKCSLLLWMSAAYSRYLAPNRPKHLFFDHGRETKNRVQGRPKLVAHVGQEFRLGTVCCLGLLPCDHAFLLKTDRLLDKFCESARGAYQYTHINDNHRRKKKGQLIINGKIEIPMG